ncbi:hypothetical protein BH09ACT9_BH09ACT9_00030 [soil metagenome]
MTAELIYKTTSPKAIKFWLNWQTIANAEAESRKEFIDRMTEKFGAPEGKEYRTLWHRGDYIMGLDSGFNEKPPADSGWRLDSKEHIWMPALAKTKGKAWRKELDALVTYKLRDHLDEIGICYWAFAGLHMYKPGIEFDAGEQVLYQTWGSGKCIDEALKAAESVPEVVWEEVPRSVWYAREESREAAMKS